jgi:hypothetical protein
LLLREARFSSFLLVNPCHPERYDGHSV